LHLVGCFRNYITMHGFMNVKFIANGFIPVTNYVHILEFHSNNAVSWQYYCCMSWSSTIYNGQSQKKIEKNVRIIPKGITVWLTLDIRSPLLPIPQAMRYRRRPAAAWLLGTQVRIPLRAWMLVFLCAVSSSLWSLFGSSRGVILGVCVFKYLWSRNIKMRRPGPDLVCCATEKKTIFYCSCMNSTYIT
jgi:hypothetical protein